MFQKGSANLAFSRRNLGQMAIAGLASAIFPKASDSGSPTSPNYAPVRVSDSDFGSYTQSWFLESFLELADDLTEAKNNGKRFAVIWELDGCPYCRETHLINFAIPQVTDFIRANFAIVRLDLKGAREVINFNGTTMSERDLAKFYGIRFTPTIQFFPETLEKINGKKGEKIEVARIPGYLRPFPFLLFFQFVHEKAYLETNFHKYLNSHVALLKASGRTIPSW